MFRVPRLRRDYVRGAALHEHLAVSRRRPRGTENQRQPLADKVAHLFRLFAYLDEAAFARNQHPFGYQRSDVLAAEGWDKIEGRDIAASAAQVCRDGRKGYSVGGKQSDSHSDLVARPKSHRRRVRVSLPIAPDSESLKNRPS